MKDHNHCSRTRLLSSFTFPFLCPLLSFVFLTLCPRPCSDAEERREGYDETVPASRPFGSSPSTRQVTTRQGGAYEGRSEVTGHDEPRNRWEGKDWAFWSLPSSWPGSGGGPYVTPFHRPALRLFVLSSFVLRSSVRD